MTDESESAWILIHCHEVPCGGCKKTYPYRQLFVCRTCKRQVCYACQQAVWTSPFKKPEHSCSMCVSKERLFQLTRKHQNKGKQQQ
jgi:hypothetical protein